MKKLFCVLLLIMVTCAINSQPIAKAFFAELGGPGLVSFNYDQRFTKKENGLGGRIGIGGVSIGGNGVLFIPVGVNYLLGKDGKNYFEVGGGITPAIAFSQHRNGDNFETSFGHFTFGYRLQPKDGGFFFRAAVNPVFNKDFFWPYYGGLSFGYKLK